MSVTDLQIFWQNDYFQHAALKKVVRDLNVQDQGLLQELQHNNWAYLAAKGYQGAAESFQVVHSKNVCQNSPLSLSDKANNCHISSDTVIFKMYFANICSL